MFARLIGSFAIVCLISALLALLAGFGDDIELAYRAARADNPPVWQIGLTALAIAVTLLPPWWSLQRAIADGEREA